MTDYLEEALEGIDALVKRLRRTVKAAPVEEDVENVEDHPSLEQKMMRLEPKKQNVTDFQKQVYIPGTLGNEPQKPVDNPGPEGMHPEKNEAGFGGEAADTALPDRPEPTAAPAGRIEGSELSAQSDPLRMQRSFDGAEGTGTVQTWKDAVGPSESRLDAGQGWAEQADRLFRRDSRRYDGGFYLY